MAKKKSRRGYGEGSVEELPDGRWRAFASAGKDASTGKRTRPTKVTRTKKEALDWLAKQRERHAPASASWTVGAWCADWLARKKGEVEPRTYSDYEGRVRRHITPTKVAGVRLAALTIRAVEDWLAELAVGGTPAEERRKCLAVFRLAIKDAVRHEVIARNPAALAKPPKAEKRAIRPLDASEVRRLLSAVADSPERLYFHLALDTGMRTGELWALHWTEVDLDAPSVRVAWSMETIGGKKRLKVPKTPKSRRTLPISQHTAGELRDHLARQQSQGFYAPDGLVVQAPQGGLADQAHFSRAVRAAYKRAGIVGARPMDLRHTCATHLLCAGVNIRVVSERLGHSEITTTLKHYASYLPGMQAVAAQTMETLFGEWHANGT